MLYFRLCIPIAFVWVLFAGLVSAQGPAGPTTPVDSAIWNTPDEFVMLDVQPRALNLEDIRRLIVYPREAKRRNIQGKVILRVLVDPNGVYVRHKVLRTPDILLTQAVEAHISLIRFSPPIENRRFIATWLTIPFDFQIDSREREENSANDAPAPVNPAK